MPPANKPPHPLAFVAIAVAAFGAFSYTLKHREQGLQQLGDAREKRIPHPNPLTPPTTDKV